MNKRLFTTDEARAIGEAMGIDFTAINLEEFKQGLMVELEHGSHDPETNVTDNDEQVTGKIAWAHPKSTSVL